MIKKSLKYILIAGVNATILTIMLVIWTDKLELTFNTYVRPIEFLKIIGLTILSLIGMRVLIVILNKRAVVALPRKKVLCSIALTLAISSYLYGVYAIKVSSRLFDQTRQNLTEKIEDIQLLAYGTKADNLTKEEYSILQDITWFPEIPNSANKISYLYTYDGFLPDYTFQLTYEVPEGTDIEEIDYEKGDFSRSQKVEIKEGRKLVSYEEGQW